MFSMVLFGCFLCVPTTWVQCDELFCWETRVGKINKFERINKVNHECRGRFACQTSFAALTHMPGLLGLLPKLSLVNWWKWLPNTMQPICLISHWLVQGAKQAPAFWDCCWGCQKSWKLLNEYTQVQVCYKKKRVGHSTVSVYMQDYLMEKI